MPDIRSPPFSDMRVLDSRDAIIFGPGNGLPAGVGVIDEVGGPGVARVDAGLNVYVSEFGYPGRSAFPRATRCI